MDQTSVQGALTLNPSLPMQTTWQNDHTLQINFGSLLTRGQSYMLTISTAAKAKTGAALADSFKLPFDVADYLKVTQVIPAANTAQVEAASTITVIFSRPVVPLVSTGDQSQLVQPLAFSPAIVGQGQWVSTAIYVFKPTKPLPGGTTFTATVAPTLKDVTGSPLDKPTSWTFTTVAPQILSTNPTANQPQFGLKDPIMIQFNQPMDHASTESAFSLVDPTGKAVPGVIKWVDGDKVLLFTPQDRLTLDTRYTVSLTGQAHSASGVTPVSNPTAFSFKTVPYPAFISSSPTNGEQNVPPGSGLAVSYNTVMDEKSFIGHIHVAPDTKFSISASGSSLYVSFASLPQTTYTVTIDAGIMDVYGNPVKNATTITFTTTAPPPQLTLPLSGQFALTRYDVHQTNLPIATIGVHQITGSLSSLNAADWLTALFAQQVPPPNLPSEQVVHPIQQAIESDPTRFTTTNLTLGKDSTTGLPIGLYRVTLTAPDLQKLSPTYKQIVPLAVSTANLTVKASDRDVLIWATDLQSGQPVANLPITVYAITYNQSIQTVVSGTTDAQGVFKATFAQPQTGELWAVGQSETAFGVGTASGNGRYQPGLVESSPMSDAPGGAVRPGGVHPASGSPFAQYATYLYTDQPIYRPARPVYFRGVIRQQDDITFTIPTGSVAVTINDPNNQPVYQKTLPLSDYGTFSDQIALAANAPLGYYNIEVKYQDQTSSQGFQVAEYRPPEFQVATTPKADQVIAGDTISVQTAASFFFGGAVSNAAVTWNAQATPTGFNYTGDGNWNFNPITVNPTDFSEIQLQYERTVGSGSGKTDAQGHFAITLPADLGGYNVPQTFTVEANVTDLNNQPISGRTTITVHPATVYAGYQLASPFVDAGKPTTLSLIAVDTASQPVANQKLTIQVARISWEQDPKTLAWKQVATPVATGSAITDSKGLSAYTFTPDQGGYYQILITTHDAAERLNGTQASLYVAGVQPFIGNPNNTDKSITLVADKKGYQIGDQASILIASPFAGTVKALVTTERARVMTTQVIDVTGGQRVMIPITADDAPNIYISVVLIAGTTDGRSLPDYRTGTLMLHVKVPQVLIVKLTSPVATAQPGQKITFDVLTTDLAGKPIAASLGLKLTDAANLSIADDNSGTIFEAFWSDRPNAVGSGVSISALIDGRIPTPQLATRMQAASVAGAAPMASNAAVAQDAAGALKSGGGGGGGGGPAVRSTFVDTPFWAADVRTDDTGKATVTVTLPDNLTTWRLDGRGISQATYAGQSTTDLISTKPLLIRPATPRFFVVGDQAQLAAVVNNNTGADQTATVTLDAKGATFDTASPAAQTVTIPKDGRARVAWNVTIADVANVDLTFSVTAGSFSDASKPTVGLTSADLLPVYKYVAPDYVGTAGQITTSGTRTEGISLPVATAAPTSGQLTVALSPSLAAATIDGLTFLRNYPYQCIEQTISRFLPNIVTYRALQQLHQDDPALKAALDSSLAQALSQLTSEQHSDGGWGWYPIELSDPTVTAYAVLGLIEARAADLTLPPGMLDNATRYLLGVAQPVSQTTDLYTLNREAFVQYVLARNNAANVQILDSLFTQREKMSLFARAFLAEAYAQVHGDQGKINTLLSDLSSAAILSGTGAHWEESTRDWFSWDSDVRTTAIVLKALVDLSPNPTQNPLIPNIVRWLMVARRGIAWVTTQDTAWSVMSLTGWMVASGELQANYSYNVAVNGTALGSGTADASTLRQTRTLSVDVSKLLADQINKLAVQRGDGPGALYYTAQLAIQQPVESIVPVNRGLAFTRAYLLNGKPVTSAHVGDVLTVALDISVPHNLYFAVINDPIPAGTETVDTQLKTTSQIGQAPDLQNINAEYGWGWWWFSSTELHTNGAVLTARTLPAGTYRYTYQIIATQPGIYRVIPPNGQEFYFPEVFGRGAGSTFTVLP